MGKGDMILVYIILHGFLEGVQWLDFIQMAHTPLDYESTP